MCNDYGPRTVRRLSSSLTLLAVFILGVEANAQPGLGFTDSAVCSFPVLLVSVDAKRVRQFGNVPPQFTFEGLDSNDNGAALLVLGACSTDNVFLDGKPLGPHFFHEALVFINSPEGQGEVTLHHLYVLWSISNNWQIYSRERQIGLFGAFVANATYDEIGFIGASTAAVEIPWTYSPYHYELATAPTPSTVPAGEVSVIWHLGSRGLIRGTLNRVMPGKGTFLGTGTIHAALNSPLAQILGAAEVPAAASLEHDDHLVRTLELIQ